MSSAVVLDGDDQDNIRAVKKAATDDACFAPFFILDPDVEFANFSMAELVEVAIDLAHRESNVKVEADEIMSAVASSSSGKEFLRQLSGTTAACVRKGEHWGVALMRHAVGAELLPAGHARAGSVRPLVEVARLLIRALDSGYVRSVEASVVDPETGDLRPSKA
jgi:hypothetical protein